MNTIHWLEAKQLDRVTNFSTETECVRNILQTGHDIYYYCTFAKKKVYYGLEGHIIYLGHFKNRVLKHFEWPVAVMTKALSLVRKNHNDIIMVNQDLVKLIKPAIRLNKLLKHHNKFVLDIRTLPTEPEKFDTAMKDYYSEMKTAIRLFDGLSFITPYMEKVSLQPFHCTLPTVNWSSGVDVNLFDANKYDYTRDTDKFRIFYHGGISESRGNLDLVKACEKVVQQGYGIELVQIGKKVDKTIENYIQENHLESWCKLYDARPLNEIPAMVAQCDLPLLPFPDFLPWRVSSPIKLMEYLAMGKPVLVPNMECFTDILPAGSGMVYYYPLETDDVIQTMAEAIVERIQKRSILSQFVKEQCCIDYVTHHFTWQKQAQRLLEFCLKLCK